MALPPPSPERSLSIAVVRVHYKCMPPVLYYEVDVTASFICQTTVDVETRAIRLEFSGLRVIDYCSRIVTHLEVNGATLVEGRAAS